MSMPFSIRHWHNLQTHAGVDVGNRGPLLGRIHECPNPLDPWMKSLRSSNVKIQLPSFPFGCYTNPLP